MASTILQLSQLITTSVAELIDACATKNLHIPDVNHPFTRESEAFRMNTVVAKATNNIAAAAIQLAACVLPPQESILQVASGHLKSAAVRVALECHVPEILRAAGSQGLHAEVIAAKNGVDGQKLARLLRVLTNRHIFQEVRPDVFANNRISSYLDTGKSFEEITNDPEAKHDNTSGENAFVEILVSDAHKGSAYILENLKDPITARSGEPHHAPIQRGLGINKTFWELLANPAEAYRRRRFGVAMNGHVAMDLPELPLKLFDWGALPKDAVIVDVGGGIGNCSRLIWKAHPNMNFVVQDSPSVVEVGTQFWKECNPEAIQSGRVKFQVHDFFTPQPIKDASVFLVKNILHDWSEERNLKILSHLRCAAAPDTVLLILDTVMVSSTQTECDVRLESVPETQALNPPSILSTGYTSVSDMAWTLDICMMTLVNAQEYTVNHYDRLLASTGWKIVKVIRGGNAIDSVLARPV